MIQQYNRYILFRFIIISFFLFIIAPQTTMANDEFKPNFNPTIQIERKSGEIIIDGKIDDPGWIGAALVDNFCENSPGDQIEPPVKTEVFITYDDNNLYLALICYDNPEEIRASYCERDNIHNDDNIGFFFDTYGDASWAYMFNANPYGFQYDAIRTTGYGEDGAFDMVWQSVGQITDSGYQIEVALPFAGMRFPNTEEQTWKIEFWRHYLRDSRHSISWSAYDRDESCWQCQWGTMTGMKNIKPGKGVEILASAVGFQSRTLNHISGDDNSDITPDFDTLRYHNESLDGDASVGIKYAPSSNFTLEATLNPDFSQVEADADQIDVNSTTALSFPERRPFFQEGLDIFRTIYQGVYSRSINDPFFAAKATARIGRTSIGYLSAFDESSPVIIPFEESSSPVFVADTSFVNILRVRQTFGDNSQIGFLTTDRRFKEGGSGSILGLDGSFRLNRNFNFRGQIIATHTDEPNDSLITRLPWEPHEEIVSIDSSGAIRDTTFNYTYEYKHYYFDDVHTAAFDGESFWGRGYIGILDYEARNIFISGRYSETNKTFRLDNGYEPRNNRRQASLISFYSFRFDEGLIQAFRPEIFIARIWNIDGQIKDEWVNSSFYLDLRKLQIGITPNFMLSRENYAGIQFDDIWSLANSFEIIPSGNLGMQFNIEYGHRIARKAKIMGYETSGGAYFNFKPTNRIRVSLNYSYVQSRATENKFVKVAPDSLEQTIATDDMLFKGFLARTKISMQYNRELTLRLVVQYNDFSETWDFDPLITYRLTPFSMFYIGSTYDYGKFYNMSDDEKFILPPSQMGHSGNRLESRQFFVKLQYLFQL